MVDRRPPKYDDHDAASVTLTRSVAHMPCRSCLLLQSSLVSLPASMLVLESRLDLNLRIIAASPLNFGRDHFTTTLVRAA